MTVGWLVAVATGTGLEGSSVAVAVGLAGADGAHEASMTDNAIIAINPIRQRINTLSCLIDSTFLETIHSSAGIPGTRNRRYDWTPPLPRQSISSDQTASAGLRRDISTNRMKRIVSISIPEVG